MTGLFELTIISPEALIFQGKVSCLKADFGLGQGQIFAGHAAFASLTKPGSIRISGEDGMNTTFDLLSAGFFHIRNNRAVIIL